MSRCTKGPFYSAGHNIEGYSVHTTRSKQDHKERRRQWDCALSAKSVREYEPRINRHTRALVEKLKGLAHQPSVRISRWINFFSFDVMGDIGFNRSFGMMESGQEDELIKSLHEGMAPLSVFIHLIWMMPIATRIRVGVKSILDFMDFSKKVLRERKMVRCTCTLHCI